MGLLNNIMTSLNITRTRDIEFSHPWETSPVVKQDRKPEPEVKNLRYTNANYGFRVPVITGGKDGWDDVGKSKARTSTITDNDLDIIKASQDTKVRLNKDK